MSAARDNANRLGCELAGEVVRTFGRVRVRVTGTSMIPAVWPGDVLVVERRAVERIERGEIAVAERDGRLVAHRVIGARADAGASAGAGSPVRRLLLTGIRCWPRMSLCGLRNCWGRWFRSSAGLARGGRGGNWELERGFWRRWRDGLRWPRACSCGCMRFSRPGRNELPCARADCRGSPS